MVNLLGLFRYQKQPQLGETLNITIGTASAAIDAAGSTTGISGGSSNNFFDVGESVSFTFDRNVEFLLADFNNLSGSEFLNFNVGGTNFAINDANTDISDNNFTFGNLALSSGDTFSISGGSGAAGIENLTINVLPATAVPEPSSAALLGLLSLGVVARRRRR